jgi:hypothetical protein
LVRLLGVVLSVGLSVLPRAAEAESGAKARPIAAPAPHDTPKTPQKKSARAPQRKASTPSRAKPKPKPKSSGAATARAKVSGKRPRRSARRFPSPPLGPPNSPAIRYAALDSAACLLELKRRGIAFREESHAPGVSIPVRLLGPLSGVVYRTDQSDRERKTSPWEVYDCRLLLSLADFSQILSAHGVSEVRIFSAYRPPSRHHEEQPSKRHQAALAVDVRTLRKASGEELSVLGDFEQKLGRDPCSEADEPLRPAGKELKTIACEAARAHLFNSILTPNFDDRHRNHFHLEVAPGKAWFLLR